MSKAQARAAMRLHQTGISLREAWRRVKAGRGGSSRSTRTGRKKMRKKGKRGGHHGGNGSSGTNISKISGTLTAAYGALKMGGKALEGARGGGNILDKAGAAIGGALNEGVSLVRDDKAFQTGALITIGASAIGAIKRKKKVRWIPGKVGPLRVGALVLPLSMLFLPSLIGWAVMGAALLAFGLLSLGRSVTAGAMGGPSLGIGGEITDSITREVDLTAVDTWTVLSTYGATTGVGTINVPSQSGAIAQIHIGASADMDNTLTGGLATVTGIRLSGTAIKNGGVHRYLGPAFAGGGKTSGGASWSADSIILPTAIPVNGGDTMQIEGIMLGEDVGTVTIMVTLVFVKGSGSPGGIVDGDFREGDITAVDTDSTLTAVGADSLGNIKVPTQRSKVGWVQIVSAVDVGADYASSARALASGRLMGVALSKGGSFGFQGSSSSVQGVTTGIYGVVQMPQTIALGVPVKGGDELELHAQMHGEDPGQMTVAVAILYGA